MDALFFTVEESTALMREVYPNYPDLRQSRPAPKDLKAWLEAYRADPRRARAEGTKVCLRERCSNPRYLYQRDGVQFSSTYCEAHHKTRIRDWPQILREEQQQRINFGFSE
jgi:hypothetical protein